MPLLDLKTDLKSLKYGADRPGGGNSGQPYIKVDINTVDKGLNRIRFSNLDDGLIRGGAVGALNASIVDIIRIGKWLTDLPKGPLWIAKQVGLQLSNPKLEIKKFPTGPGVLGTLGRLANNIQDKVGIGPTRLYNLGINTLAQIPVNAFGGHFNRHGLLPVQDNNTKYLAVAQSNNKDTKFTGAGLPKSSSNRLIQKAINLLPPSTKTGRILNLFQSGLSALFNISIPFLPNQQIIDEYVGGPGSVYGVGKTTIRRYDHTSNTNNKLDPQEKGKVNYIGTLGVSNQYFALMSTPSGATSILGSIIGASATSGILAGRGVNLTRYNNLNISNPTKAPNYIDTATYSTIDTKNIPLSINPTTNNILTGNVGISFKSPIPVKNASYQTYQKIVNSRKLKETTYTVNGVPVNAFGLYGNNGDGVVGLTGKEILPDATSKPVYSNGNKIVKINIPWNRITRETRVGSGLQDQINLTPIFSNNAGTLGDDIVIPGVGVRSINDLVKFRIQALNGNDPTQANWMIFRAYLTQLSDNTDATWNPVKYTGRGEDFYVYNGFSRKIQIGFKAAALSADEMKPMYQKLNYLMGNVMPDYSGEGLMRGPLVKMTVGNWIDGQDGILNNISYTIPQDSPWEIGLKVNGKAEPLILPHIVEVSMTFTPIGSQTKGVNKISSKSYNTSHIAQNYNQNDPQYIEGEIQKYNGVPRINVPSNYTRSDENINFGFLAENAG